MHGIGPKVANCIMLFGLGDVAAFPVDTWVRHIMNDMYGFAEKDVNGMMEFAHEKFGKYAGYAQQYLFYYYREKGHKKEEICRFLHIQVLTLTHAGRRVQ